jgi:lipoprotein-releasing system ATP-binding protein
MSIATLDVRDLSFGYPSSVAPIFAGLDLVAEPGQMVAVRGKSGTGKSTLLFLLGLFIAPSAGRIAITGVETTALGDAERSRLRAHKIGFVFQDAILHPTATLEDNVAEGALYSGASYAAALADARRLIESYGIGQLARRLPTQVSGGQAQRAALCRALIRRPALVLADEPTGNLDPDNATEVIRGLRGAADEGASVVVVTHSPTIAGACDRVIQLG